MGCKPAPLVDADLQHRQLDLGMAQQWSGACSLAVGEPVVGQRAHFVLHSRFAGSEQRRGACSLAVGLLAARLQARGHLAGGAHLPPSWSSLGMAPHGMAAAST
jgi:hypothetical protein